LGGGEGGEEGGGELRGGGGEKGGGGKKKGGGKGRGVKPGGGGGGVSGWRQGPWRTHADTPIPQVALTPGIRGAHEQTSEGVAAEEMRRRGGGGGFDTS